MRSTRGNFSAARLSGITLISSCILFLLCSNTAAQSRNPAQEDSSTEKALPSSRPMYDPVADQAAIVRCGHARFTILTPELIRLEWSPTDLFEDHASLVFLNRRLSVPAFRKVVTETTSGHRVEIKTDALVVTYEWKNGSDGHFTAQNLQVSFQLDGKTVSWMPGLEDRGNLMGTARTLDGSEGSHMRVPMEPGLVSRDGWVLVDDSSRPLFDSTDFSFTKGDQSPWPWVLPRPTDDHVDWYFFGYGHQYRKALGDFIQVAGRIPLPPKFAFGAWWSRYWAYSDQELRTLADSFAENDVPLDVLVIDMDWHLSREQLEARHETDQSGHRIGWSGYTWNPLLFPNPGSFLDSLRDDGLKVALNLHPASGVQPWEKPYPVMARAMGIDPASRRYVPFDITNRQFARNYMSVLHHPLEKQGIDFWWLDWQQETQTRTPGVNPTWWLNYVHFTDQEREGKRPLLFHRWGGLGNHRYQIGFSGDTISVWESLAYQPWFTSTAANVGYAYWSHDIGGHMPGVVSPELYTRWVQFGTLSPILRTHTTKNPDSERRIWVYPEPYADIMRKSFQFRYALQPYIYTEARRTYDSGIAFLHPLYYDWPDSREAYDFKGQYMFGDQVMVAPITTPVNAESQLARQDIWIPPGEWIDWATGERLTGPRTVTRNYSISQVPVFVKSGTILPMAPPSLHTLKQVKDLIVTVFPMNDKAQSSYSVYEDDSSSEAYKHGACAWTDLRVSRSGQGLTVEVAPIRGHFPGLPVERSYEIRLPDDVPPQQVLVNGQPLFRRKTEGRSYWSYDGNTMTTRIVIPAQSLSKRLTVRVQRSTHPIESEDMALPGTIERLREAYDALRRTWPVSEVPDELVDAMQTGDRLTYDPAVAQDQLASFKARVGKAADKVRELHPIWTPEEARDYAQRFHWSDAVATKKAETYKASVEAARAAIDDIEK